MNIALFIAVVFLIGMGFLYRHDERIAKYRQRNPKFYYKDRVIHIVTGSECVILKQTTKQELDNYYQNVPIGWKPYSGYWVKVIKYGKGVFGDTVKSLNFPVAESTLKRI